MKIMFVFILALMPLTALATVDHWFHLVDSTYSVPATSTLLLKANGNRKYLLIQNIGSSTVTITLNASQASTEGIQIVSGGNWEPPSPPTDAIYGISTAGVVNVNIVDGQ